MNGGSMQQGILAIDQGTSGTKAVLFSPDGRQLSKGSVELTSYYPLPGYMEQDPLEIYKNACDSARLCLSNPSVGPVEIVGIGISNQRETFILWDNQGRPITPAIVWQDKRSTSTCADLISQGLQQEISQLTGLTIDPYFSGTKFLHLISHDHTLMQRVESRDVLFGTIDSWLLYKLTNGLVHATDTTNASRTLFFNIHTQTWDDRLLEIFHANDLRLPEIHHSPDLYGFTDINGLLASPVPIRALIGDSHASSFGLGCFSRGSAKATLGTGTSILMNVGPDHVSSRSGLMSTICHDSGVPHYGLEGIIVSCGSTLSWLRDSLGLMVDSSESEAMAEAVPDNGGVYLVPAFAGLGAPYWRMDAKGCIAGLTFESRREHVVRAALESIAYQIKDVVDTLESDSGYPLTELMLDGGISRNRFVMQMIADLTGIPVITRGITDVSALGAALMAGLQAGFYTDLNAISSLLHIGECYEPHVEVDAVKIQHLAWKNVVKRV
jgi:glycerol kinase